MEDTRDARSYEEAKALFEEKRYVEALSIYEELAKAGDSQCQIHVGWMHSNGFGVPKDQSQAFKWFRRAADLGSREGAFYCGRLCMSQSRYDEALAWFQQSAKQGFGPALLWIGLMHTKGWGVAKDFKKGAEYLERAARTGNYYAQRTLALMMIRGKLGPSKIPVGLALLPYAVFMAVATMISDPRSDRVKG